MRALAGVAVLAMLAPSAELASGPVEALCGLPDLMAGPSVRLEQVSPGLGAQAVELLGRDVFVYGVPGLHHQRNPVAAAACPLYNNPGGDLVFSMEGAQPGVPYLLLIWVNNQPFLSGWHHVFVEAIRVAEADGTLRVTVPFVPAPIAPPGVVHLGQPLYLHGNILVYQGGEDPHAITLELMAFVPVPRQV